MNTQTLFTQFSSSIHWNAYLYIFYKISSTIFTFILYGHLTSSQFSAWANILSFIFITLLWADFGMRKSIPRFAPVFAQSQSSFIQFTRIIIIYQLIVLFIICPLFFLLIKSSLAFIFPAFYFSISTHLATIFTTNNLIYFSIILFITEGLKEILRLIFYARFWNKPFNLLASVSLIIELCLCALLFIIPDAITIEHLLLCKILSSLLLIILSSIALYYINHDTDYPEHTFNTHTAWSNFIQHSSIIWSYTTLKSFSERNFLIPVFTYILGPGPANLFKIAQDGALIFERSVLKTIGTSDTSLLAYAQVSNSKSVEDNAFKKLIHKVALLCIPLFGILFFFLARSFHISYDNMIFQIFSILIVSYLLELLFSPYERVLEVKQRYGLLMIAYTPYIIMLCFLFIFMSSIGLLQIILLLQGVRLVSSLIMVALARYWYGVTFPWVYVGGLVLGTVGGVGVIMYLGRYLPNTLFQYFHI